MKRCATARFGARVSVHTLERRVLLSAASDLTDLTALRQDPLFAAIDGSDVTVAVLDTGIFGLHPQLRPNVLAFYNAVTSPVPTVITGASVNSSLDGVGHGSHVAGTVASTNPEIGVAPGAKIVAVKVLADPGESQLGGDAIVRGLEFVERFADQFNIKAVNMSLGFSGPNGGLNLNFVPNPDAISRAIDDLEAIGITVVSASGNSYANNPVPGAGFPAVSSTINVASVWSDTGPDHDFSGIGGGANDFFYAFENSAVPDRFSATSQRSTLLNQVVAPGVDIFSTWNGAPSPTGPQLFNTISGTSMASPFVSGVVALMQDAAMTFGGQYLDDPSLVLDILRDTADVIVDTNVPDNGRFQVVGGALSPTPLPLPETGEAFMRVNAHAAVERVRNIMLAGGPNSDLNNTAGTATSLPGMEPGSIARRRGRIGTDGSIVIGPNDVDLFKVTLTAAGDLSVSLAPFLGGQLFTPSLRVFDAAGNEIAQADGVGLAYPNLRTNPTVPLTPGVYYVGVSSMANVNYVIANGSGIANGLSEGDYDLTISVNSPDINGVATGAEALNLTVPDTLAFASEVSTLRAGVIGLDDPLPGLSAANAVPSGDVDMFSFVAPDTGTLQARTLTRNVPGGPVANTFLRVFNSSLAEVGFNDNNPAGGFDSLLSVPVTSGQTYYIGVTNATNFAFNATDATGRVSNSTTNPEAYDLYLNFASGDTDGTAVSAVARTIGTPVAEAIGTDAATVVGANGGAKDVDFSLFTAPSAGLLDLQVTGAAGVDSVLALWKYNTLEHTIVKLGEAAGAAPRLIRQVGPGEILYASVTGAGNGQFNWFSVASGPGGETGTYTLNSTLRPTTDLAALSDGAVNGGTPGTLAVGTPILGTMGMDASLLVDADVDVYRFIPGATGRYDIRTDTSAEESADTVLRLFDAAGTPIAMNDDATGATNSSALRVALTAGQTYYVGISGSGAGSAAYDVLSGAGAAAGSQGTYGLTVNPTAAGAPGVVVANAAPTAESFRDGSVATFTIALDAPATSAVTVAYSTVDGTAVAGADYTATSGTVTFAPGEQVKTITVPVTGDLVSEGEESFGVNVAVISGAEAVVSDEHAVAAVTNQVVQAVGFNSALRATFTDLDGDRVVVRLSGPGSGELLLIGDGADAAGITLTGTTARSVLTVSGDTSIGDVTVNGSLKGLNGKALDLIGDLSVAGTLAQLRLRNVSGGTISLAGGTLNAVLGSVADGSLASAGAIKSLRVAEWVDGGGVGDLVSAASIGSISASGDFGADVTAGSIGKMTVRGALLSSDVRSSGTIGAVRLGSASGSRVFAGVGSGVTTLPDGLDDFVNADASIKSFSITGRDGTFSNSMVAAPSIGKVLLGTVATSNGGTPFGVAADSIRSLATNLLRLRNLEEPGDSRTDADFNVRVL